VRIHDADGVHLVLRFVSEATNTSPVFPQYRSNAVAEILENGDLLESFGKDFDETWIT
jgi:hypothetical protein